MTTQRSLARIEKLIWVLIYAGLLTLVLGLATQRLAPITGWVLVAVGAVLAVVGFVLIPMRARMRVAPGAQSKPTKTETQTE